MEEFINFDIEIKKAKFKHFKGGVYETIDAVFNSETCEPYVLYRNIETKKYWFRPIAEFFGIVNNEDYNGPRFVKIGDIDV